MSRQITTEDAYREACTALGEGIVQQRLLAAEIGRLDGEVAKLAAERDEFLHLADQAPEPPPGT